MQKNTIILITLLLSSFIVLQGLIWYLIQQKKNTFQVRDVVQFILRFIPVALLIFVGMIGFFFGFASFYLHEVFETNKALSLAIAILGLTILYLSYISIPFLKESKLKTIPRKTLSLGVNQMPKLIGMFVIILIAVSASSYLLFLTTEFSIYALFPVVLLWLCILIWIKVFLTKTVQLLA